MKQHFDVALLQARKFRRDSILLLGFLDIDAGPPTAASEESGIVKASEHIIEETIHLPMQTHYRAYGVRSCRRAALTIAPSPGNKISNIHGRYLLTTTDPRRAAYKASMGGFQESRKQKSFTGRTTVLCGAPIGSVFQPSLAIAIDDAGRRWIAEVGNKDLPGPVWCVFPDPQVAVHVSNDLHTFLAALYEHAHRGQTLGWLQDLRATADAVWAHRRALALRSHHAYHSDEEIRGWLSSLPSDAYVYDLRRQNTVRGWPYGVAGPSARMYRCGRPPVFAVARSPTEGWRVGQPVTTAPANPLAAQSFEIALPDMLTGRRRPRFQPMNPSRWR